MNRVAGVIWHKGMAVPVEVEVSEGWLGLPAVIVHIPKVYAGADDLTHMIDFKADLDETVEAIKHE